MRFLRLLFFTGQYLHQAYVYDNHGTGVLHVEFVIDDNSIEAEAKLSHYCWIVALWRAAHG